ncbi:MAG: response regulator [Deltaproteobacteria bacterium]|nr:response regulator [Deltaproteobacteria bacterium]
MTKKILIVAPDRTVRLMAGFTLQLEDYEILEAEDMQGAMEKLDAGLRPALILNGLDLIRSNGAEFVAAVRKRPEFRFVPILTLADEAVLRRQAEWKEVGVTGWISQPFTGRQLLEMVNLVMF